jgi:hypothetical protein
MRGYLARKEDINISYTVEDDTGRLTRVTVPILRKGVEHCTRNIKVSVVSMHSFFDGQVTGTLLALC